MVGTTNIVLVHSVFSKNVSHWPKTHCMLPVSARACTCAWAEGTWSRVIFIVYSFTCDSFDCELHVWKNSQSAIKRISQSKPDLCYTLFPWILLKLLSTVRAIKMVMFLFWLNKMCSAPFTATVLFCTRKRLINTLGMSYRCVIQFVRCQLELILPHFHTLLGHCAAAAFQYWSCSVIGARLGADFAIGDQSI